MAVTINGVAARWGLPSDLAITETVVGTFQLQGFDLSKNSEVDSVRDSDGDTVAEGWYDPSQEATLEYIVTGATIAAAKLATKIPAPGTIVTLTVTATETGESITGTKWTVTASPKITMSNTGWTRITLPLRYRANVTAVATAA